jgi:hypothetical protein
MKGRGGFSLPLGGNEEKGRERGGRKF